MPVAKKLNLAGVCEHQRVVVVVVVTVQERIVPHPKIRLGFKRLQMLLRCTTRTMTSSVNPRAFIRLSSNVVRIPASRTYQTSSLLHRSPAYPGHVSLNTFENAFLTVGSALMAFMDPRRGGKPPQSRLEYFRHC